MDLVKLKAEIIRDEGRCTKPYKDDGGLWTGGIGHNLEAHGVSWTDISTWLKTAIPADLIDKWFAQDVAAAIDCCRSIFPSFDDLPDNVQRVLVNMAFDLMYALRDWHDLMAAIAKKDWTGAAMAIMDSRFAHQGPNRCSRLAARIVEK